MKKIKTKGKKKTFTYFSLFGVNVMSFRNKLLESGAPLLSFDDINAIIKEGRNEKEDTNDT